METKAIRDSRNELRIETRIDLPGVVAEEGRRSDRKGETKLAITTSKGNRGELVSRASVSFYGDMFVVHAFGLGTGKGDFSCKVTSKPGRATEKALRELHEHALVHLPMIIEAATRFYAAKGAVANV